MVIAVCRLAFVSLLFYVFGLFGFFLVVVLFCFVVVVVVLFCFTSDFLRL